MKKIVLVDDYESFLIVLKEFIEINYENVECETFSKPLEALKYIESEKNVDLLITDYEMPKMNGFELASRVLSKFPNLKIIISSGHDKFTLDSVCEGYGLKGKVKLSDKGDLAFLKELIS